MIGWRGTMRGTWRGEYGYDPGQGVKDPAPVRFELELKQTSAQFPLGHFDGICRDESGVGAHRSAKITGSAGPIEIRFQKQYEKQIAREDSAAGSTSSQGDPAAPECPPWLILYEGIFDTPARAVGSWLLPDQVIPIDSKRQFRATRTTGTWWMERA